MGSAATVALSPVAWNVSRPDLQVQQVQQQMQILQNAPPQMTSAAPLAAQAAASSFLREQQVISSAGSLLQLGLRPEMWGIRLGQLQDITKNNQWQQRMNTRDVVVRVIWPATSGKGVGYALLQNQSSPLRATVMVSHAWDDGFLDFLAALRQSGKDGPFWVAAAALYQSEEAVMQALRDPEGMLRHVMQQGGAMLCVQASKCNVYKRLWCLFEMYVATSVGLEVEITRKPKGGFGGAYSIDPGFVETCSEPVDSKIACCGPPGVTPQGGGRYEQALRRAAEAVPGSYKAVDGAVELARLKSLTKSKDQMVGGGWSKSEIGRQYSQMIDTISVRIGVKNPTTTSRNSASERSPSVRGSAAMRQRHAPVSSI